MSLDKPQTFISSGRVGQDHNRAKWRILECNIVKKKTQIAGRIKRRYHL